MLINVFAPNGDKDQVNFFNKLNLLSILQNENLLMSNNLSDFVELTKIIPAVRTDHDAISLELGKL